MEGCETNPTMSVDNASAVIVKTTHGTLKGKLVCAGDLKYYSFTRIPYAKPPLGILRFAPPSQLEPWTEIREATEEPLKMVSRSGMICYENLEDCLYIDIYTPDLNPRKPLPVMFWFNCWKTTDTLGPRHLLEQGVIVVICSFRNGCFGFLTTLEMTAPGNSGLKDITIALRFVKQNISEFGGDKNNVTIFGSGRGGSMVHYMMLSPMTCGLFHRAIAQSGSALSSWSSNHIPLSTAQTVAKKLGKELSDPSEIIDFLRGVDADDLFLAQMAIDNKILMDASIEEMVETICVETEHEGQESFITKNPVTILKSGNFHKVPLMIGSNSNEGLSMMCMFGPSLKECLNKFNNDITQIIPLHLKVQRTTRKGQAIALLILNFYIGGSTLTKDNFLQLIQMLTDYYCHYYINRSIKQSVVDGSKIYYYLFDFPGDSLALKEFPYNVGCKHGDELPYIFELASESITSRNSRRTQIRMVKLWTNFAKYGNPTPDPEDSLLEVQWPAVQNSEKLTFLNIGAELSVGMNPFKERMMFWDLVYAQTLYSRITACFNLNKNN